MPKINFLSQADAKAIVPPTEEEIRALISGAEELRPVAPLFPEVIELLIEFGFRPAELFHLPWASVDWNLGEGDNRGAVRVEEQSKTIAGKTWTPKNKRYRTIPFTVRGREILERLRKLAGKAKPSDLVIPNTSGMPYTRLDDGEAKGGGSEVWRTLKQLSGVQASMRELRHAFAVANLMRGVPIPVVSQWMGHSKSDLTVKRYGRFAHEAREQWHWAALRARPVEEVAQAPRKLVAVP